jgi:leader peptidase (prepilin peptidase)/N-methyltransferase
MGSGLTGLIVALFGLRGLDPMLWWVALLGLVVGSFLNVCIYRVPRENFFASTRSFCTSCGAKIPWWLNLPLVGWVLLKGKTRCCGERLSVQYPLVELATALLFGLCYAHWPFASGWAELGQIEGADALRFVHAVSFGCLLLVCSVIDWEHMIVPDVISLPMIALTPVIVWMHPELTWDSALIGVIAGGGSLYLVAWGYWFVRREVGMGMGDVKLLAAIGGWLGWQAIVPTLMIGSIVGALGGIVVMGVTRRWDTRLAIPFGPFLSLGAWIHLMYGQAVMNWWSSIVLF